MTNAVRTVLLVEDDVVVAEIYRLALERAGYHVVVAHDGRSGLEAAARSAPDLVFLDIRMPKLSGVEVLRELAANETTKAIPVVMLSNFDEAALTKSCLELGAKQYLLKVATNPTELPAVVARWLGEPDEDVGDGRRGARPGEAS